MGGEERRVERTGHIAARFIRLDGELLIIEFETPHDEFDLPGPDATITVSGLVDVWRASIDPERSTRPGTYDAGRTVRLALRQAADAGWPSGEIQLNWHPDVCRMTVHVTIP
jgi:hypothetical protein